MSSQYIRYPAAGGGGGASVSANNAWTGTNSFSQTITSTVASGGKSFQAVNGSQFHFGSGAGDYISSDGSNLTTPAAFLAGAYYGASLTNGTNGTLSLNSAVSDGASAVGVTLGSNNNLTTAGALLISVTNNGLKSYGITFDGKPQLIAANVSATPGSVTVNAPAGIVAIAAASAAAITVTNNTVLSTSRVFAQVASADATCKSVQVVVSAGSFTITPSAATTAITKVFFEVHD